VEVCERDITLIGCASTEEAREMAEEVAKGVSGVRHVENHILVKRTAAV
jgi:osmotically-inducible protein OsmY